jgi:hypothetical protein
LLRASLPLRPLFNHAASLADGVATTGAMLDGRIEHGACRINTVAGVQQPLDALIVFRPQLNFVEVALVCVVPIGGRFGPKSVSIAIAAGCGLAGAS